MNLLQSGNKAWLPPSYCWKAIRAQDLKAVPHLSTGPLEHVLKSYESSTTSFLYRFIIIYINLEARVKIDTNINQNHWVGEWISYPVPRECPQRKRGEDPTFSFRYLYTAFASWTTPFSLTRTELESAYPV